MIGIITYVSVLERTKEIGILRALGARKKDISRVFNAETFLIGLTAGAMGVTITAILTIPINLILNRLLDQIQNIASFSLVAIVSLIAVSIVLTLISGLIPSRIAARKDPVEALRTE
jgi:putative ABC transport system permease protein